MLNQKYRSNNRQPLDSELQLKIQQERDFALAYAIAKKRGLEIFVISNLPNEHFKNIIAQKEATKKPLDKA